jgi:alpha-1,2-mannosyltransferase
VDLKGLTFQIWEFALWFITLSLQSHKEERFMYVVYPIICFNAAYSVHVISLIPWPKLWLQNFKILTIFCFLSFSMLRIVGQYSFYGSATTIYNNLKDINPPSLSLHQWKLVKDQYANSQARYENRTLLVCLGDEWYRFPSHYFLKEDFRIGFIKGGFNGLLPKYFKTRSHPFKIEFKQTRVNNLNKPEEDRWVDSQTCDYFIGLDKEFKRPRYVCMDFLDKENTHAITRAFYLGQAKWQSMCIFTR